MKTIKPDELFQGLNDFLKGKGIELKDGSYAHHIRQGCTVLSDAINATQKTVKYAKVEVDKQLDQLRQSIHEATAPEPPPVKPTPKGSPASGKKKPAKLGQKRKAASPRRRTGRGPG